MIILACTVEPKSESHAVPGRHLSPSGSAAHKITSHHWGLQWPASAIAHDHPFGNHRY